MGIRDFFNRDVVVGGIIGGIVTLCVAALGFVPLIFSGFTTFGNLVGRVESLEKHLTPISELEKNKNTSIADIEELTKKKIEEINKAADMKKERPFPVGSIISSMLPPNIFITDERQGIWELADGKPIPKDCLYANLVLQYPMNDNLKNNLPDLRGMFLRGVSYGRNDGRQDPDNNREVGSFQNDMVGPHVHKFKTAGIWKRSFKGEDSSPRTAHEKEDPTDQNDGVETRPKNVAVYYYIKIN